ncbi:hypothetical protein AOG2_04400 [Geobacter sp. AOG2]|nr:hypothetical protein [Geobacter sp. AOG2]GFE59852.1 hypothetical protein AOG2_04400 [Geobacter sp. AOG2]
MAIYLDNAATSHPKPESTYQAVIHAMRGIGASPGRLFSVPDPARIIFTHNVTESLNLALRVFARCRP